MIFLIRLQAHLVALLITNKVSSEDTLQVLKYIMSETQAALGVSCSNSKRQRWTHLRVSERWGQIDLFTAWLVRNIALMRWLVKKKKHVLLSLLFSVRSSRSLIWQSIRAFQNRLMLNKKVLRDRLLSAFLSSPFNSLPRRLLKLRAKNRWNLLLDTDRYRHTSGPQVCRT